MLVGMLVYALVFFLPSCLVSWLLMQREHPAWAYIAGLLICTTGGILAGVLIRQSYLRTCGDCSSAGLCCEWLVPSLILSSAAALLGAIFNLAVTGIMYIRRRKRQRIPAL